MPYYHSFGWYYFAKYIFGLAGMIYLYTGIFKEKSIVCPCPAEERQLQQRKESNNECSSTGDQSDAPVQISCCAQTLGLADVKNENVSKVWERGNDACKMHGRFRAGEEEGGGGPENPGRRREGENPSEEFVRRAGKSRARSVRPFDCRSGNIAEVSCGR
ncbi:uncharacterized protein [Venturia canescens]|uniref:uncharacterized protein isoform X2 n=1 Tax=Venturia canescens TaxID=32260 RepID=UPI001C9D20A7|nr:uncharacterized protein LOC122412269 isoform X2 [Venturia canescens]